MNSFSSDNAMSKNPEKEECSTYYYNKCGRLIGELKAHKHKVKGKVFAVDDCSIYIHDFHFDGPDAYFWAGATNAPSIDGFIIPHPHTSKTGPLPHLTPCDGGNVLLTLPGGKKLSEIKWLAIWCIKENMSFGDVFVPESFEAPKPRILCEFKPLARGLTSDEVTILDSKTIHISNLCFNSNTLEANFLVGKGIEPSADGIIVPDERGSTEKLRIYGGEDIVIQLPDKLQVYDIDWLSIYCIKYTHDFGHVIIPKELDVPPAKCTLNPTTK